MLCLVCFRCGKDVNVDAQGIDAIWKLLSKVAFICDECIAKEG